MQALYTHRTALVAASARRPAPRCARTTAPRRSVVVSSAADPNKTPPAAAAKQGDEAFEGLLPEEDYEVPGTYFDALAGGTKLGKAVRAACDELNHLGGMESEALQKAEDLLKKLGMKGTLFAGAPLVPPEEDDDDEELLALAEEEEGEA